MLGKRLITFLVLPNRELAAAFAGIGSLIAGAGLYQDKMSWPAFVTLPPGAVVHWKNGARAFSGKIIGIEGSDGAEFIRVEVTKPTAEAKMGLVQSISKTHFDDFHFSEESPPSALKSAALEKAERHIGSLLGKVNPKWIWADGAEAILVTSLAAIERSAGNLFFVTTNNNRISMLDFLCARKNSESGHAKLRLAHPRGKLNGNFPLAILDGSEAFHSHQHLLHVPNLLFILDRSEYDEGMHGSVISVKNISSQFIPRELMDMPDSFPEGFEIASFVIDE